MHPQANFKLSSTHAKIAGIIVLCVGLISASLINSEKKDNNPTVVNAGVLAATSGTKPLGQDNVEQPDCHSVSPFRGSAVSCKQFDPDAPIVAKDGEIMTDDKLIALMGVTTHTAMEVLQVVPGASVRAMETLKECKVAAIDGEKVHSETVCSDLRKIQHYVLMDIDFHAKNGDPKAALAAADFYARNLDVTHENNVPLFLRELDAYASIAQQQFPKEVEKLQELAKKHRT